jgi:hypothetical protein
MYPLVMLVNRGFCSWAGLKQGLVSLLIQGHATLALRFIALQQIRVLLPLTVIQVSSAFGFAGVRLP